MRLKRIFSIERFQSYTLSNIVQKKLISTHVIYEVKPMAIIVCTEVIHFDILSFLEGSLGFPYGSLVLEACLSFHSQPPALPQQLW